MDELAVAFLEILPRLSIGVLVLLSAAVAKQYPPLKSTILFLSGEVNLVASYSRVVRPSELPSGHVSSRVQHLATAVQLAKAIRGTQASYAILECMFLEVCLLGEAS